MRGRAEKMGKTEKNRQRRIIPNDGLTAIIAAIAVVVAAFLAAILGLARKS